MEKSYKNKLSIPDDLWNIQYYGCMPVDILLVSQIEKKYDAIFMKYKKDIIYSRQIRWLFNNRNCTLYDECEFINTLLIKSNLNYRYIITFISINYSHRNVLIIDNKLKQIHYFEPNRYSSKYIITDDFENKHKIYDKTVTYFYKIINKIPKFNKYIKVRLLCNSGYIYTYIYEKLYPTFEYYLQNQGCTQITYYYLYKVLNGEYNKYDTYSPEDMINILTNKLISDDLYDLMSKYDKILKSRERMLFSIRNKKIIKGII